MIEVATPADFEEVCELLTVMHRENGQATVNQTKARGVISQRIRQGSCFVAKQKDKIVGSLAIYLDTWWYSDSPVFFDQWFFVHPEHRTEGHAVRLLAVMKQVSRNEKTPFVLSVGTDVDALSKLKFFKKHLTPFGGSFIFHPDKERMAA